MYSGPIIDVDVHHNWSNPQDLVQYVTPKWRELLEGPGMALLQPRPEHMAIGPDGHNLRLESFPPEGGPPGSSYDWMRAQLLDPLNVRHAVLCYDIGLQAGVANPYLATELCRAANDWSMEQWLDRGDERIHGAILVAPEQPSEAAKEIRRAAKHPQMAEVLLVANTLGRPFGHPIYRPIHEAAVECGLPIAVHLGAELPPSGSGYTAASGTVLSRLDRFALYEQGGMHHVTSLLTHGVFNVHPELRVLLKEYGFTWLPWLLWRLDSQFETLRRENQLVTELPSEVFRRHAIVSMQPFPAVDERAQLIDLLESFGGMEDFLVFATDYPHWDADEPKRLSTRLPQAWHERLFYRNAARFFGFDDEDGRDA